MGQHVWLIVKAGEDCPSSTPPDEERARFDAVMAAMDMMSVTAAVRPSAAAPEKPHMANRTRNTPLSLVPMNPVQHHAGTGQSRAPSNSSDSAFWRKERRRADGHYYRCEVTRRAATYLASLIRRDPDAKLNLETDRELRQRVIQEGDGWPLRNVARVLGLDERFVLQVRLDEERHPLTGARWTPPADLATASAASREMRDAGLGCTDISRALGRPAGTIRRWNCRIAA